MRLDNELKLNYDDVLLKPKRSTLSSRRDVDMTREFKFRHSGETYKCCPIIASNMDGVGTFSMAKVIQEYKMMTTITKTTTLDQWKQAVGNGIKLKYVSVCTGTNKLWTDDAEDYATMKEVLKRRFSKALKEEKNTLALPDLILIDGGKGQYSISREVLNDLGLHQLPVIAIAKGKNRNAGNETFFYEEKTIKFKKNDPTLFFLQRLRDEAHRFAISTHRSKRRKNLKKSLLDQISGIGKSRKRYLLNHFGSAKSVESARFEDLKSVEGIEEKVAKKIHDFFHED